MPSIFNKLIMKIIILNENNEKREPGHSCYCVYKPNTSALCCLWCSGSLACCPAVNPASLLPPSGPVSSVSPVQISWLPWVIFGGIRDQPLRNKSLNKCCKARSCNHMFCFVLFFFLFWETINLLSNLFKKQIILYLNTLTIISPPEHRSPCCLVLTNNNILNWQYILQRGKSFLLQLGTICCQRRLSAWSRSLCTISYFLNWKLDEDLSVFKQ